MYKEILAKIKKSKNDGTLAQKILYKLNEFIPVHICTSKNVIYNKRLWNNYKSFQKKYRNIIDEEIETSEPKENKTIWICWFQGIENAPELIKICYNSLFKNLKDYKIVVLTDENIDKYCNFSKAIKEKRKRGLIPAAHYSDLVRIDVLVNHGGIWLDSTVYFSGEFMPTYITNSNFFIYKEIDLLRLEKEKAIVASSWLIASKRSSKILKLTKKLLWQYWEDYSSLKNYFIFHIFMALASQRYKEEWDSIPLFNNHSPHILELELNNKFTPERWEQIKGMSDFHKLKRHYEYNKKETFYGYLREGIENKDV